MNHCDSIRPEARPQRHARDLHHGQLSETEPAQLVGRALAQLVDVDRAIVDAARVEGSMGRFENSDRNEPRRGGTDNRSRLADQIRSGSAEVFR